MCGEGNCPSAYLRYLADGHHSVGRCPPFPPSRTLFKEAHYSADRFPNGRYGTVPCLFVFFTLNTTVDTFTLHALNEMFRVLSYVVDCLRSTPFVMYLVFASYSMFLVCIALGLPMHFVFR